MDIKPCTCGEIPDLESSTYGWDSKQKRCKNGTRRTNRRAK